MGLFVFVGFILLIFHSAIFFGILASALAIWFLWAVVMEMYNFIDAFISFFKDLGRFVCRKIKKLI